MVEEHNLCHDHTGREGYLCSHPPQYSKICSHHALSTCADVMIFKWRNE